MRSASTSSWCSPSPGCSPTPAAYSARALTQIGVDVLTGTMVTGVDARGVDLGETRIEAATVVWAAGVAASPLAAGLDADHDRAGRVRVAPDLSIPGHPEVFVVGDAAAIVSNNKPAPGIAPAAKQAGKHAARQIAARLAGRASSEPFAYVHAGDLATIGRHAAAVQIGQTKLTGFIGWVFWGVAHVYFLIGLRNRIAVAFDWLWSWLTRQRNIRLIVQHRSGGN